MQNLDEDNKSPIKTVDYIRRFAKFVKDKKCMLWTNAKMIKELGITQEEMELGVRIEKKMDTYMLFDKNNNSWNLNKFTKDEAIKASKTLVDCFLCRDCVNCKDCWYCEECSDCINCRICRNCKNCVRCYKCENLQDAHRYIKNKLDEIYWGEQEQNNTESTSKQQKRVRR